MAEDAENVPPASHKAHIAGGDAGLANYSVKPSFKESHHEIFLSALTEVANKENVANWRDVRHRYFKISGRKLSIDELNKIAGTNGRTRIDILSNIFSSYLKPLDTHANLIAVYGKAFVDSTHVEEPQHNEKCELDEEPEHHIEDAPDISYDSTIVESVSSSFGVGSPSQAEDNNDFSAVPVPVNVTRNFECIIPVNDSLILPQNLDAKERVAENRTFTDTIQKFERIAHAHDDAKMVKKQDEVAENGEMIEHPNEIGDRLSADDFQKFFNATNLKPFNEYKHIEIDRHVPLILSPRKKQQIAEAVKKIDDDATSTYEAAQRIDLNAPISKSLPTRVDIFETSVEHDVPIYLSNPTYDLTDGAASHVEMRADSPVDDFPVINNERPPANDVIPHEENQHQVKKVTKTKRRCCTIC